MRIIIRTLWLAFLAVSSGLVIYVLFQSSENIIHYQNNFTRRFPHHLAKNLKSLDLKYNSYYLAGAENGKIYLGNITTPLRITVVDSSLQNQKVFIITVDNKKILKAPQIRVIRNQFYLYEGSLPVIFIGSTSNWHAKLRLIGNSRFSLLEPVDSSFVGMRYFHPETGENILGTANLTKNIKRYFADSLLKKQIDGIFDTDGMLRYDSKTQSFVYVHLYKNEVIVCDKKMMLRFRSKTIDTVTHTNIRLINSKGVKKFASPPLIVNKTIAVSNGLLFVNSQLAGQYEEDAMWKSSNIVDIYDLKNGAYLSSFYLQDVGQRKLDSFIIRNSNLYALIGNHLVSYSLKKNL